MKQFLRLGGAWMLLASLAWAIAAAAAGTMAVPSALERIALRDPSQTASYSVMSELRENIGGDGTVTAWTQRNQKSARNSDIGTSAQVDVLWFDGNAGDVWDLVLVNGFMPQNDSQNCAIDVETANTLFGSTDIIGCEITVDGVDWTVSGVFALPEGMSVWGADPDRGLAFCPATAWTSTSETLRITGWEFGVASAGQGAGAAQIQTWLGSVGVSTPSLSYDRGQQQDLYRQLSALPGWIVAVVLCFLLAGEAWRCARNGFVLTYKLSHSRKIPRKRIACVLAGGLLAACLPLLAMGVILLLAQFRVYVPPEYLPTQWSDTAFWPSLVSSFFVNHARLAQYPSLRPDAMRATLALLCFVFSAAAIIMLLNAWAALRRNTRAHRWAKGMLWVWAAALAGPVLGGLLSRQLGLVTAISGGLAVIPLLLCAIPALLRVSQLHMRAVRIAFHHFPWPRKKERGNASNEIKLEN